MNAKVTLSEVQHIIVRGIRLPYVRYYFLTVVMPERARGFLQTAATLVPSAEQKVNGGAATIALTYSGLWALQAPDRYLSVFRALAPAFVQGAATRAATHLGDTGRNESPGWELPFRSSDTHVLLTLYAKEEQQLDAEVERLRGGDPATTGLSGWSTWMSGRSRGTAAQPLTEPFGFRDGISQPTIKGVHLDWAQYNPPSMHVEPGEFLLGHPDEDGSNRWAAAEVSAQAQEFVRNGSFVALRKMRQHRQAFKNLSPLVQAKMCGRWPNGALVLPGQSAQPAAPAPEEINRFDFSNDPRGDGCPYASHIRRLNPRGDEVIPPRKRFLMRRGTRYQNKENNENNDGEVGLMGVFICANLERQFEFLMSEWTREAPMIAGRNTPDPLIGARNGQSATFPIPTDQGVENIKLLDSFVTTRGTLYGFYPSLTSLGMISARFPERHT